MIEYWTTIGGRLVVMISEVQMLLIRETREGGYIVRSRLRCQVTVVCGQSASGAHKRLWPSFARQIHILKISL